MEMIFRGNALLVPVNINGVSALMILNTGSGISMIDAAAVADLHLQRRQLPSGVPLFSSDKRVNEIAHADDFTIGRTHYRGVDFPVLPLKIPSSSEGLPIVGGLGMDILGSIDLDLDFIHGKIGLFSQDHCPGQEVYWASRYDAVPIHRSALGDFYFPMELNGKKIQATLSTDNPVTTLGTDVYKKLYGFDEHAEGIETETDATGHVLAQYRAMALTTNGLKIMNARILLIEPHGPCKVITPALAPDHAATYDCLGSVPLKLGMNVIRKLHLYLAMKEKMLHFTAAADDEAAPALP